MTPAPVWAAEAAAAAAAAAAVGAARAASNYPAEAQP